MRAAVCKSGLLPAELLETAKKINSTRKASPIQLLDFSGKLTQRQLSAAEKMALDSIEAGCAVSSRPEIEFLLFLACTPHVKKAAEVAGIKNNRRFIVAVFGNGEKMLEKACGEIGAEVVGKIRAESESDFDEIERMALSRISG